MIGDNKEKLAFSLISLVVLILIVFLLHSAGYHTIKWLFVNIGVVVAAYAHWLQSKITEDNNNKYGRK